MGEDQNVLGTALAAADDAIVVLVVVKRPRRYC